MLACLHARTHAHPRTHPRVRHGTWTWECVQDKDLKFTLIWTTVVSSLLGCTSVILYTHANRQTTSPQPTTFQRRTRVHLWLCGVGSSTSLIIIIIIIMALWRRIIHIPDVIFLGTDSVVVSAISELSWMPVGHNYVGHNDLGHNYIGHNYLGYDYILVVVSAISKLSWMPVRGAARRGRVWTRHFVGTAWRRAFAIVHVCARAFVRVCVRVCVTCIATDVGR